MVVKPHEAGAAVPSTFLIDALVDERRAS